ncbi:MAG: sensor histidine kinase [Eubacteriales bacterium]|nr:sensor histidine kinase [Eubacteriales bacterium]
MKKKRKAALFELLSDYRFNSILIKNLIVIFLVFLCSFVGITSLVSVKMQDVLRKEVRMMSRNSLNQTKEHMDTLINEVVQISAQLTLDDDIMFFLLPDQEGNLNAGATAGAKERIQSYGGIFDYIDSIYVYANKTRYVVSGDGGGKLSAFQDRSWYENFTERVYEPARMISRLKYDSYPMVLSYLQPVRLTQMQFLGGIIINIDVDKLYEQIATENFDTFYVVDDRDNILFSNDQSCVMKKWSDLDYTEITERKGAYDTIRKDGEEMILSSVHSSGFDWRYVVTVPMAQYQQYQNDVWMFFIVIYLLIFVIAIVAAVSVSVYSYSPVQYILNLLKNPDLFDPDESWDQGLRQDEVKEITGNIVRNFYSSKQLQKELEDYLNIINNAQITALQAQISPHFLFNTLENLRWKAMELSGGDNEVAGIILNLSEMLRISLDNSRQVISLRDEMNNAKLYVEILKLRYGDKVHVEWDIPENLYNCQIVKVTLQPLIENAVYHGIKPKRGKGLIQVSGRIEGERLLIEVRDDGVGMSPEEVEALNNDLKEMYVMKPGHIGVRNVGQRLKLILGENADIRMESSQGEGAVVKMNLPLYPVGENIE